MVKVPNAAILILAAGESRRLGLPKQLIEIDGETLIHRVAREAAASNAAEILVMLGHEADRVKSELTDLNVATIYNSEFARGMGTSIRHGVSSLADHDAILISVCDQPHLTAHIFNQLIERLPHSSAGIVCSRYQPLSTLNSQLSTNFGVPAAFAKRHFPALLALADDAGAKGLITANDVDAIDFPLGSVDIDTHEDLANLKR